MEATASVTPTTPFTNGTTSAAAVTTAVSGVSPAPETPTEVSEPVEWDAYIASQPDTVKVAYEAHTAGLKSALSKERDNAKALAKQIKDLQNATAEERDGKLAEMAAELAEAQRRIGFITSPEAGEVVDTEAAYTIAAAKGMFDAKGVPKWADLKAAHPALFKKAPVAPPAPDINGGARGSGAGSAPVFNGRSIESYAEKYGIPLPRR